GADRELLVTAERSRRELWTSRVWPGALLVGGEVIGTWRRAGMTLTVQPWRRLSRGERSAVEVEAESLPLPGRRGPIGIRWSE
ncbi:MAG: winged helix DNA-binding domain-containing protein, partial [Chloroflexi bacterium]|nr:winged helix DNA-binding domain-containing protein [Chloroflexota bacterium]